ncbi:MAG: YHS domain-containing (seleno)protein [Pseudomonadota bacterium]
MLASTFKPLIAGAAVALAMAAATVPTEADATEPIYQTLLGTAIDGTDPVSYFTEGRPVEGSSDFTYEWNGATWRFASAENREAFIADPARYAPQYGGYCAWAVSQGYTASTTPEAWAIVDDKLYLNYSASVQETWNKDVPGFIASADENWPGVIE